MRVCYEVADVFILLSSRCSDISQTVIYAGPSIKLTDLRIHLHFRFDGPVSRHTITQTHTKTHMCLTHKSNFLKLASMSKIIARRHNEQFGVWSFNQWLLLGRALNNQSHMLTAGETHTYTHCVSQRYGK